MVASPIDTGWSPMTSSRPTPKVTGRSPASARPSKGAPSSRTDVPGVTAETYIEAPATTSLNDQRSPDTRVVSTGRHDCGPASSVRNSEQTRPAPSALGEVRYATRAPVASPISPDAPITPSPQTGIPAPGHDAPSTRKTIG